MIRAIAAMGVLLALAGAAHALGLGKEGFQFGRLGFVSSKKASGGGGCSPTGLKFNVACNSQYLTIVH